MKKLHTCIHINCFLSVTIHINCSVACCLINVVSHGMCLYQVIVTLHFLNVVANVAELTQKIDHNVILASLKSEST